MVTIRMPAGPATPDDLVEEYRQLYDSRIEWHCQGRHGVVRGIKNAAERNKLYAMLVYYFGDRCAWRTKGGGELEFVHKAKVFPAPTRPWGWCGTTVLFDDWRRQEEGARELAASFKLGDQVAFDFRGQRKVGFVSNTAKRVTVIADGQKFYVPASQLERLS
jgi:hypothetical protein